jgi:hypothetical protein
VKNWAEKQEARRRVFPGGPKRDKPAQVSFLSFSFYVFFPVFFSNCFESNLNLNVGFTFESIIQIHTLMLE